jgi:hypothetical protein
MTDNHLTNDLTTEQLRRIIANHERGVQLTGVNVHRQLLSAMQENERLSAKLAVIDQLFNDMLNIRDAGNIALRDAKGLIPPTRQFLLLLSKGKAMLESNEVSQKEPK